MKRVVLAYLFAPWAAAVSMILFGDIVRVDSGIWVDSTYWILVFKFLVLTMMITYFIVLLVGLPGYFLFKRFGWYHLWQIALYAVTLGLISGFVLKADREILVICVISSLFVGIAFWFIGVRGNQEIIEKFTHVSRPPPG